MKKIFLLAIGVLSFVIGTTQSTVPIRGDTIRVYKQGSKATLKVDSLAIITGNAIIGRSLAATHYSASLDLRDSTRAILLNRMWDTSNVTNPVNGMLIYQESDDKFYRREDDVWVDIGSGGASALFGVTGQDRIAQQNRTFSGNNQTYSFRFDSLDTWDVARAGNQRLFVNVTATGAYSPTGFNFTQIYNDSIAIRQISGNYSIYNLPSSLVLNAVKAVTWNPTTLKLEANEVAIINETNPQAGDILIYDDVNEEWDNIATSELFGKWEWMVDDPNYPNPGDSVIVDSNIIDRFIKVFRDGDFQYENGLTFNYEHEPLTGELIFHPPLAANERITIFTFPLNYWSNLTRRTAPTPPAWFDFDYDAAHDLEELVTDQWTVKGAASIPYTAVADGGLNLPASTDGGYRIQFDASITAYDAIIGFDVTTTNNSYDNFDFWAQCGSDGTIYVNENTAGSINTGVQCSDGDYLAIFREGSVWTCKKSSNGITWTLVHTYTGTTTAIVYPKADVFSGTRKLLNPQGWNLEL